MRLLGWGEFLRHHSFQRPVTTHLRHFASKLADTTLQLKNLISEMLDLSLSVFWAIFPW
jgi:hypothetical protein